MTSQEEEVQGGEAQANPVEDAAKFSGAWDELDAQDTGQSAPAAERQEEGAKGEDQGEGEAGQGEAQAGQPAASTSPEADAAAAASRKETTDDVWAKADPALREAHESALKAEQDKSKKAENLARSNGGRLAKALTRLSALEGQLADKAGAEGGEATSEEVETLRRDFPEVANPLLKQIDELRGTVKALSTSAKAEAESDVADALSQEHEALFDKHPDIADIVKAPEYEAWLKDQKPFVQRIVQDNAKAVVSAADTEFVFDKFKLDTGWGKAEREAAEAAREAERLRQEQLDAGRSASGAQPGMRSDAKTGDGSFGDEWDKLEAQDRRKAAGRR